MRGLLYCSANYPSSLSPAPVLFASRLIYSHFVRKTKTKISIPSSHKQNQNQTKPNQTTPNQTKPTQTKPNQTKPNPTQPNPTQPNPNQTKPVCVRVRSVRFVLFVLSF